VNYLYHRYFGSESIITQRELFTSRQSVLDYVRYLIAERYPEDRNRAESIADDLYYELTGNI